MQVILRLEGVAVLADSYQVQVVGLTFGEVVVQRRPSQRRKQSHDRRERDKRADTLDHRLNFHHTKIIA